jgi:sterol desaturase/sphingolipid hydroxylase (fatty acid hydroxylase superfamily)
MDTLGFLKDERAIRFGTFLAVFLVLAGAEIMIPKRALRTPKARRWIANLIILALNPLMVIAVFPMLPVALAQLASTRHWGVLQLLAVPDWAKVVLGVIVLDLVVYVQHVLHHAIPTLWRLHMVHHADMDIDVTTGLRFHPIEIAVSMALKLAAVAALGPPPLAVLLFEVALNATAMFNHSNMRLPERVDRKLRLILVTPDMHRVHHSVIIRETNSNYGFSLPWWDRLFGTYQDQPARGHQEMTIGLAQFRDPRRLSLAHLLVLPFVGDPGRVPINRH